MSSNNRHVFPLLALYNAVIHITIAANASDIICPDGSPEITDFGDLNKPGSGRLLLLKNDRFQVDGEKVFLSGINTPFLKNGKDFGNGHYHGHKKQLFECYLRQVHSAGGNTMRTFLHGTGSLTPAIEHGFVTGLDSKGSFITEVKTYLRTAAKYDIVIFLSLWDLRNYHSGLDIFINDESVLQSYIDNGLVPLMKAIKDEPGFGGVDIMSGADGMVVKSQVSSNPCYDTSFNGRTRGGHYSMQNILRFVSRQADAIHSIDPDIIVTTELHFDNYVNDSTKFHFTDSCLLQAGGRAMGYLDFYSLSSFHTTFEHFKHNATDFPFYKPFVISSFSEKKGDNKTSPEQFKWAYFHGYSGAWSWAATTHFEPLSDSLETQLKGLEEIRFETDSLSGGLVAFSLSKYKTLLHPFNSARESD